MFIHWLIECLTTRTSTADKYLAHMSMHIVTFKCQTLSYVDLKILRNSQHIASFIWSPICNIIVHLLATLQVEWNSLALFPPFPSLSCLLLQVQCFAQKFAKKVAETIENQQLSRQYPVVLYIKLERFNCSLLKAVIRILVLQIISIFQTKFSKITSLCVVLSRAESEHNTAIAPSLLHLLLSVAVSDWLTACKRAVCHLARGQRPEVTRVKN
ncbi:hypothetical protein T4D_3758 [Trichinella pseudospiralis]|uniref:Uncharacterized protein n=1 Tax=Trichinella pseudospiralis TaxID=6337 RepID=A0A0V1FP97_TRIPS|nr:hypothetical protein T4D_3758 [Trichinella pseudospiralis]